MIETTDNAIIIPYKTAMPCIAKADLMRHYWVIAYPGRLQNKSVLGCYGIQKQSPLSAKLLRGLENELRLACILPQVQHLSRGPESDRPRPGLADGQVSDGRRPVEDHRQSPRLLAEMKTRHQLRVQGAIAEQTQQQNLFKKPSSL